MGIGRVRATRAAFPDLADATQQLEEIVDSETRSPANAGLFFGSANVTDRLVPGGPDYFCFHAPPAS